MTPIDFPSLPSYLKVFRVVGDLPTYTTLNGNTYTDDREGRIVRVEVHSDIHVSKVVTLPHSWSEGFINARPKEWLGDIHSYIVRAYGLELQPVSYA